MASRVSVSAVERAALCASLPDVGKDVTQVTLREAKILQIVEGTNQVQRVVIGRSLTSA